jgi:hypothetical protein
MHSNKQQEQVIKRNCWTVRTTEAQSGQQLTQLLDSLIMKYYKATLCSNMIHKHLSINKSITFCIVRKIKHEECVEKTYISHMVQRKKKITE